MKISRMMLRMGTLLAATTLHVVATSSEEGYDGPGRRIRHGNSNTNNAKEPAAASTRRTKTGSDANQDNGYDDNGESGGRTTYFNRVATWFVCSQLNDDDGDPSSSSSCNDSNMTTSAEQLVATADGNTILYTNALLGTVGAVDISDIFNPVAAGSIALPGGGEPTSIAACPATNLAIVAVDTSMQDKVNPLGVFHVIDMETLQVVYTGDLDGQPDCIKISKDCTRAVVAIENERNEDLYVNYTVTAVNATTGLEYEQVLQNNTPGLPQYPGGFITIIDITAPNPADWTLHNVNISGLLGIAHNMDPEPEFVSINENNIVIVTLQENNGLVVMNATDYTVLSAYSAGDVTLVGVDTVKDGEILPNMTQTKPREPDGVVWLDVDHYVTADEGDWMGGTRGFTIWTQQGDIVYTSGTEMDRQAQRLGHYPEHRSSAKGNEPENVEFGIFHQGGGGEDEQLLFVNSERSSLIFVYDVKNKSQPILHQLLPAGVAPEGGLAIPSRNLFVVASEEDERALNIRGSISIYYKNYDRPVFPFIVSSDREPGIPIPFGALSSLATGKCPGQGVECEESKYFYSVDDSVYKKNRIFKIDPTLKPAVIVQEIFLSDVDGVLRGTLESDFNFGADTVDLVIDPSDQIVHLDVEGVDTSVDGGFWIIHQGPSAGTEPQTPEMLLYVNRTGVIKEVIPIPTRANETQGQGPGMEDVAEDYLGNFVVVSFRTALLDEEYPRLAIWDRGTRNWTYMLYPVDDPESQYASEESMIVVSDLAFTGKSGQFLVIEHDNRSGPDAAVKRIYQVDLTQFSSSMEVAEKTLVFDIMSDLKSATNGPIVEKIGGLTTDRNGGVWIINDNGGMNDNNGETVLIQVGEVSSHAMRGSKKHSVDNHSDDDFVADEATPEKRKKANKKSSKGASKNSFLRTAGGSSSSDKND